MSNEQHLTEVEKEALDTLQKFATIAYNKGSKDTLIGVMVGVAIGATALGVSLFIEWRKIGKVKLINE